MTHLVYSENPYQRELSSHITGVYQDGLEFDQTIFYPMGGGQSGDRGQVHLESGEHIDIIDTRKGSEPGRVLHLVDRASDVLPLVSVGCRVDMYIDWERRYRHMRFHTALHLLSALIDAPVTGGSINAEKSRLDFDLPELTWTKSDLSDHLNQLIKGNHGVCTRLMTREDFVNNLHLIRTKNVFPPEGTNMVRLIEIDNVDLQPCGGTHVSRTSEIGTIVVSKIEKKGRQNRRITIRFND